MSGAEACLPHTGWLTCLFSRSAAFRMLSLPWASRAPVTPICPGDLPGAPGEDRHMGEAGAPLLPRALSTRRAACPAQPPRPLLFTTTDCLGAGEKGAG